MECVRVYKITFKIVAAGFEKKLHQGYVAVSIIAKGDHKLRRNQWKN